MRAYVVCNPSAGLFILHLGKEREVLTRDEAQRLATWLMRPEAECPQCHHKAKWVEGGKNDAGEAMEPHWRCDEKPGCPCECWRWCEALMKSEEDPRWRPVYTANQFEYQVGIGRVMSPSCYFSQREMDSPQHGDCRNKRCSCQHHRPRKRGKGK